MSESPRPGPPSQPRCPLLSSPVLRPQFQTLSLRVKAPRPSLPFQPEGLLPGGGGRRVLPPTGMTVSWSPSCLMSPLTGSSVWRLRCYHFSSAQLTVGQEGQHMFVEQSKGVTEGKNDDVEKEMKAATSRRNLETFCHLQRPGPVSSPAHPLHHCPAQAPRGAQPGLSRTDLASPPQEPLPQKRPGGRRRGEKAETSSLKRERTSRKSLQRLSCLERALGEGRGLP